MTKEARRRRGHEEVVLDLGLGGLFKGIGTFIDLLSEMAQAGASEVRKTGTFRVKDLGEGARGVYGFSVRMGIGGVPHVEPFGNIRATEKGPTVAEVREPLVDVFDEDDAVLVVAELPGVAEEEIRADVHDDILRLQTTGERKYAKEVVLPASVQTDPSQRFYRHGILELRYRKLS